MPLSSIYIPAVSLPATLPPILDINRFSQWHQSALLSAAMETVTLQTRVKDPFSRSKFAELSTVLNESVGRNIASLSMELTDDDDNNPEDLPHGKAMMAGGVTGASRNTVDLSWDGWNRHVFASIGVSRGPVQPTPNKSDKAVKANYEDIPVRYVLCSFSPSDILIGSSLALHRTLIPMFLLNLPAILAA